MVAYCDLGHHIFGAPRAGGYKWQYILIATFSSSLFFFKHSG